MKSFIKSFIKKVFGKKEVWERISWAEGPCSFVVFGCERFTINGEALEIWEAFEVPDQMVKE